MFQVDQLHSDYFDNLNKVGNVVNYLFVIVQRPVFLLHILHSNRGDVFIFCKVEFNVFGYFNCGFFV